MSRMENFLTLINDFQLLTNVTVSSVLFAVGVLDQHVLESHHSSIGYLQRVLLLLLLLLRVRIIIIILIVKGA